MDLLRVISELRAEQEQIDDAIIALERLVKGQGKRRGRPPKWIAEIKPQESAKTSPKKDRMRLLSGRS